ncbi:MAG: hypothetical protein J5643_03195 [Lachnospiraceae bacterium]|nr:hypothetical protein [Lachnospiraceae bacterium]
MAAHNQKKDYKNSVDRLRKQAYIDGSTARKIAYRPEETPDQITEQQTKPRREVDHRPLVGFRRSMDLFSITVACLFLGFLGLMMVRFLSVNAQITEINKEITSLNKEYEAVRGENDSLLFDIADDINLNEVFQIAVAELHMVYPNKNQVVEFKSVADGYVRQYTDVPEAADEGDVDAVTEVLRRLMR